METGSAIVLHEDSVRRRAREQRRAGIFAARSGRPMPDSRERHPALLGIRRGIYTVPFSGVACPCGVLLVLGPLGPLPCASCARDVDEAAEAEARARIAAAPPTKRGALVRETKPRAERTSAAEWAAYGLVVLMVLLLGASLLRAHHEQNVRQS